METMNIFLYYDGFRFFTSIDDFSLCDLISVTKVRVPGSLTVERGEETWLVTHNESGEVYLLRDVLHHKNGDFYVDMYPFGRYKLRKISE